MQLRYRANLRAACYEVGERAKRCPDVVLGDVLMAAESLQHFPLQHNQCVCVCVCVKDTHSAKIIEVVCVAFCRG